jgi:hypothetical protein
MLERVKVRAQVTKSLDLKEMLVYLGTLREPIRYKFT